MLFRFLCIGFIPFLILGCSYSKNLSRTNSNSVAQVVNIGFERYELPNGLTVILHRDSSDPLVHVDLTYHVGSAREKAGQTGFAHFFEHMMFQGSENVDDEQHFKLVTDAGGTLNGTTNRDRTNYYQTVPANQLEKVLWLEADRMGYLLSAVTQEKFEIQRATVKNERAERIDNQPYAQRHERIVEALYPVGHPYSWLTIGYVEDLDRVNVNDLKLFFERWYGPNNAVLTIGGDIDIDQTKQWIARYFGDIPTGPEVQKQAPQPGSLEENRFVTLEDNIHLPLIQVVFPTVYARHEDEAALDVLANILGGGKTSMFYEKLVKTGKVVQAGVSHPCDELACEFSLMALISPDSEYSMPDTYKSMQSVLASFERQVFDKDALERVIASIKSSTVFGLQSVSGKASTLAYNETFFGQPDLMNEDVQRYSEVTQNDVYRVFRKYIKNNPAVVLSVVPNGEPQLAVAPANFSRPERAFTESNKVTKAKETSVVSTIDRSIVPKAGEPPVVKVPRFWQLSYKNGIEVLGVHNDETPTVTFSLDLEGGMLLEPIDKAGLAQITAMLMNESTLNFSNKELSNQLSKMGASISFSTSGRYTQIYVSSLTEHLPQTMALLQEKLFNPAFRDDEFQRTKQQLIDGLKAQSKDQSAIVEKATNKILWGDHSRAGLPQDGTVETMQSIQLSDVKAFYKRYYVPAKATLVVVGDFLPADSATYFNFLQEWEGKPYEIPQQNDFPSYDQQSVYFVDVPGSAQSSVRLVRRAMPFDATGEYFFAQLMNFPLGDDFHSRINLNLREEKGYTYGAYSSFNGGKTLGWFEAGADFKPEYTEAGTREIIAEIERYKQYGITADELSYMQNAFTLREALAYETPIDKAAFLRKLLAYDLSANYKSEQEQLLQTIQKRDIDSYAKRLLVPEALQIVIVGDKTAVMSQVESFGLPIKELHFELN